MMLCNESLRLVVALKTGLVLFPGELLIMEKLKWFTLLICE